MKNPCPDSEDIRHLHTQKKRFSTIQGRLWSLIGLGLLAGFQTTYGEVAPDNPALAAKPFWQLAPTSLACVVIAALGMILILRVNHKLSENVKRANQAELELRTIMTNIDQAIAMIDTQGNLAAFNEKYVTFSGYDEAYLASHPSFGMLIDQWAEKNGISADVLEWNHRIAEEQIPGNLNLFQDGKVYEMQHRPMPGGGYVRTYSDISELWNLNELLRKNEQKFRELLMDLPSAITVTREADGTLLYMNRAAIDITGTDEETAMGTDAAMFWESPADRSHFVEQVKRHGHVTSFMTRMIRKGQSAFWVSISSRRTVFDGQQALFSIFMDVDERKRMDEALLDTERHFRQLLAMTPAAIIVSRQEDGLIMFHNDHARKMLGIAEDMKGARTTDFNVNPQHRDEMSQQIMELGSVTGYESELKTTTGEHLWVIASSIAGDFEGASVFISAFTNITESKATENQLRVSQDQLKAVNQELERVNKELERMAAVDLLTLAWNRREFEKVARVEMSRAQRYEQALCLLMFDLDHFKNVNDHYGHLAGDIVLRELCDLVRSHIRVMDSLTRWGGEEFVILSPGIRFNEAFELADKIRVLIADHLFPEVGPITVSIGVAEYRRGQTLDEWISQGDQAMYRAKASGRNRVCS